MVMGNRLLASILRTGYICLGVSANNPALQFPLVGKCDAHIRGAIDDVIVGEDVAFRADDNAGAQALLAMIARLWQSKASVAIFAAEELAEERHHLFRGLRPRPDDPGGRYIYNRRQNRLENRSIAVPARSVMGVSQF